MDFPAQRPPRIHHNNRLHLLHPLHLRLSQRSLGLPPNLRPQPLPLPDRNPRHVHPLADPAHAGEYKLSSLDGAADVCVCAGRRIAVFGVDWTDRWQGGHSCQCHLAERRDYVSAIAHQYRECGRVQRNHLPLGCRADGDICHQYRMSAAPTAHSAGAVAKGTVESGQGGRGCQCGGVGVGGVHVVLDVLAEW